MDPEHVASVLHTLANEDWVRVETGRSNLALTVYHALGRTWAGPLALPKAVAEVYLRDPAAMPLHACEACGYRIPTYIGQGYPEREAYFTRCPLCGSRIRWELIRLSTSPVDVQGYATCGRPQNQDEGN